jgi:hypothetical protein
MQTIFAVLINVLYLRNWKKCNNMETRTLRRQRDKTINLSLNRRQVVDLFRLMDERDKEYIYNELKKNLFLSKVKNLRESFVGNELTMDEITAEVEAVRKERYETGRQIIG